MKKSTNRDNLMQDIPLNVLNAVNKILVKNAGFDVFKYYYSVDKRYFYNIVKCGFIIRDYDKPVDTFTSTEYTVTLFTYRWFHDIAKSSVSFIVNIVTGELKHDSFFEKTSMLGKKIFLFEKYEDALIAKKRFWKRLNRHETNNLINIKKYKKRDKVIVLNTSEDSTLKVSPFTIPDTFVVPKGSVIVDVVSKRSSSGSGGGRQGCQNNWDSSGTQGCGNNWNGSGRKYVV